MNIPKVSPDQLDKIISAHTVSSFGVGLIPAPGLDLVGLIAIQHSMIRQIAALYKVPFLKEAVQKMLSTLAGGILLSNTMPLWISVVKCIPIVGQAVGAVAMPVVCGASTYAAGKVFIQHFESGGTLLTLDPQKVQAYYQKMFEEGKGVAASMKGASEDTASETK
jgi:uncharacterized protein (DUF697 family)